MPFIGNKPSAVPLTSADIADSIITSAKIVDSTITNSDVASSIITGQTAETSIAGGDSVLIYDDSASALRKMTRTNFVSGIGGTNTPAFYATRTSSNQSNSDNVNTKAQIQTELFDSDGCYDNSTNYRFTPTTAGKYYAFSNIVSSDTGLQYETNFAIYKNGSRLNEQSYAYISSGNHLITLFLAVIVDMNGSTDYLEVFTRMDAMGSTPIVAIGSSFGAYKLIGA